MLNNKTKEDKMYIAIAIIGVAAQLGTLYLM